MITEEDLITATLSGSLVFDVTQEEFFESMPLFIAHNKVKILCRSTAFYDPDTIQYTMENTSGSDLGYDSTVANIIFSCLCRPNSDLDISLSTTMWGVKRWQ